MHEDWRLAADSAAPASALTTCARAPQSEKTFRHLRRVWGASVCSVGRSAAMRPARPRARQAQLPRSSSSQNGYAAGDHRHERPQGALPRARTPCCAGAATAGGALRSCRRRACGFPRPPPKYSWAAGAEIGLSGAAPASRAAQESLAAPALQRRPHARARAAERPRTSRCSESERRWRAARH